jgi:transcriptional regulator with XRE-family HTH domain
MGNWYFSNYDLRMPESDALRKARSPAERGKRLKLIRKTLGFSQAKMAEVLGITAGMWSQYESGKRRISTDIALRLKHLTNGLLRDSKHPRVTLDFIFDGDPLYREEGGVLIRYRLKSHSKDE